MLTLTRLSVLGFGIASTALALVGERAFKLLEASYSLGVAPFLLLTLALWRRPRSERSGLAVLALGLIAWLFEQVIGWTPPLPTTLLVLVVGLPLYLALERWPAPKR